MTLFDDSVVILVVVLLDRALDPFPFAQAFVQLMLLRRVLLVPLLTGSTSVISPLHYYSSLNFRPR